MGDGAWAWTRAQASPRLLSDGSVVWSGLAVEINDLKRAEALTQEREDQLRAFAESASDWFWQTDAAHRFTMFTQRFFSVTGLSADAVLGRTGWEISVDHPLADDWKHHREVLAAREPFRDFTVAFGSAQGIVRLARVSGVPCVDEAGEFLGYRGTGRDVTEEVEFEKRLRQQQALLGTVLAHLPVVLFALDPDLRFTLCAGHGLAEIGHKPGANVGMTLEQAYPDLPELAAAARRALDGSDVHLEHEIAGRVISSDLVPVPDSTGRVVAVVGMARDMTRERAQSRAVEASEARFRSLVTNLRNIVFCHGVSGDGPHGYDQHGVMVYGVDAARITGAVDAGGRSALDAWYRSIHPEDRAAYLEAEQRRKTLGEPFTLEFRIQHPATGELRWLRETAWRVDLPEREASPSYLDSYIIDLTERRRIEAAAQESEERYRRLIENVPIPIMQHSDWRCTLVNPAMVELLGASAPDELIGSDPTLVVGSESRGMAIERTRALYAGGGSLPPWEYTLVRRDGAQRIVEARASTFRQAGKWVVQVAMTDVTERKRVETAMRHLAQHDPLTGLPNRALLLDRLEQAMVQARRDRQGLALMLVDLDGFKAVNDGLGHAAGDALLCRVADRAGGILRASDTFARIGGDEFAILQPRLHSAMGATTLAGKIVEAMAVPFPLDGEEAQIGVSIGIALLDEEVDAETLMRRADMALYRAKSAGKGRYAFHEPGMNATARLTRQVESELRATIASDGFRLLYQPRVSLLDGRLVGFEALLRWPRREGGMLAAESFVPMAESAGLIRPLGSWLLRAVCGQAARWRASGRALPIAVDVAASQLRADGFVDELRSEMSAVGLTGDALLLQLRETWAAEPMPAAVQETMSRIRELGVEIVLDEFGKAPLALERLSRLPADRVKLDRHLVARLGMDGAADAVLPATIAAARGLGLGVMATAVETAAQASFLASCGCESAQGLLFGPPLPAEALESAMVRAGS
ncbi:MAG TPA: EAL domain-containing protein [Geminicoccaceae bacterium]|nr:EAL domain-containing protein [Geminicoccus sp.]HMU49930.1 EAL domain-containing protein [Geminicoccaceae bacterium]